MRLTPNNNICEPAKPDTVDWKNIKWYKVNRHVDSLQKWIHILGLKTEIWRGHNCGDWIFSETRQLVI